MKQVERFTILILTIHFELVQLFFGLCSTKKKMNLIKHNCCPYLVRLIFCSTQFLGLNSRTKSESNITTFCSRQTKGLQFELLK